MQSLTRLIAPAPWRLSGTALWRGDSPACTARELGVLCCLAQLCRRLQQLGASLLHCLADAPEGHSAFQSICSWVSRLILEPMGWLNIPQQNPKNSQEVEPGGQALVAGSRERERVCGTVLKCERAVGQCGACWRHSCSFVHSGSRAACLNQRGFSAAYGGQPPGLMQARQSAAWRGTTASQPERWCLINHKQSPQCNLKAALFREDEKATSLLRAVS